MQTSKLSAIIADEEKNMEIKYKNLSSAESYKKLKTLSVPDIKKIITPQRVTSFSVKAGSGIDYNYSAKCADKAVLEALQMLSDEQQVIEKYKKILSGEIMNKGENRMVLHHYTRGDFGTESREVKERRDFYKSEIKRVYDFADKIHRGIIKGSTGAKFDTAIQIGIGGSDLGPRALYLALKGFMSCEGRNPFLSCDFISNVDPDDASDVINRINPETTLFILVSKSGTTQETLTNSYLVKNLVKKLSPVKDISKHMVAVTSKESPMASSPDFLDSFYIDDFIGGRYSSTSAVGGVILSLAFGGEVFQKLLDGAHESDKLAFENDIRKNAPLLDAMLGIYERNIIGYTAEAILPYSQALSRFPAHLQQLMMESNGKSVSVNRDRLDYATCPVIFGEPGTNGQHSFYQQLHQGTDILPLKFIGFKKPQQLIDINYEGSSCQMKLNANLAAQITAFALGQDNENPNKFFAGGRPSDLITGERLTPSSLGSLLAHFENRTMFQGFIWNINSFDQEGVQLGKKLAGKVLGGNSGNSVLEAYSALLI
jgi:glucose-6-phosphate isomerase